MAGQETCTHKPTCTHAPTCTLSPAVAQAAKAWATAQVRDDQRHVPEDVGELLEVMVEHLFDPAFSAAALRRQCSPEPETLWRFQQELGVDPGVYLDRRRLEAACRLVQGSDARISEIGTALGFPNPESFSKWFKRRRGVAPKKLRAGGASRPAAPPPSPVDEEGPAAVTAVSGRQALVGALGARAAARLLALLRTEYPVDE